MIQVLEYTFNTRKSIDIHTYINGFEYNKHAYKLQWYLWNVHFHKCFYIYGYIWRNCSSHKESLTTLKVFWSHNTFGLVVCSNGVSNFPLEKWGETNLFFNATERADVMLLLLAEWYEKKLTVFCFFLNSQANYFQHLCNYIYNMQIYHTSPLHREKNKSKNKQTNKQTMPGEPPEWTKTPVNLVDLMTPLGRLMQSDFPIFQEFPERWFPGRFLEPSESMCQIWSKPYENNRNLQLSILFDIIMFES